MSRQEEWIVRAAVELGIPVERSKIITLSNGQKVETLVFLPRLGTPKGYFVFRASLDVPTMERLHREGHAGSYLPEPGANESFDLEGYAELFREWGWTGPPEEIPEWMED